jgi:hypothetical protein
MIELKNEIETLKKNMESMKDNHLQYVSQWVNHFISF